MLLENDLFLLLFLLANQNKAVQFSEIARISGISGGTLHAQKRRLTAHHLLTQHAEPVVQHCQILFNRNLFLLYPLQPTPSKNGIALHPQTGVANIQNWVLPSTSSSTISSGVLLQMKQTKFLSLVDNCEEYLLWISVFQLARVFDSSVHSVAQAKLESLCATVESPQGITTQNEGRSAFTSIQPQLAMLVENIRPQLGKQARIFLYSSLYTRLLGFEVLQRPPQSFSDELKCGKHDAALADTVALLQQELTDQNRLTHLIDTFLDMNRETL